MGGQVWCEHRRSRESAEVCLVIACVWSLDPVQSVILKEAASKMTGCTAGD